MALAGALFLLLAAILSTSAAAQPSLDGRTSGSRFSLKEADHIVALHNTIRAEVGVGPLRWSEELAAYAQRWADHLASSRCG
ncbi:MAG: SCP-like extracellular, partial [Proteobacteria bacterium]|nr:SCP-like extracellular [Pseudomonadota bacterium]